MKILRQLYTVPSSAHFEVDSALIVSERICTVNAASDVKSSDSFYFDSL